jgi:hypothetical protein
VSTSGLARADLYEGLAMSATGAFSAGRGPGGGTSRAASLGASGEVSPHRTTRLAASYALNANQDGTGTCFVLPRRRLDDIAPFGAERLGDRPPLEAEPSTIASLRPPRSRGGALSLLRTETVTSETSSSGSGGRARVTAARSTSCERRGAICGPA